MGLKVPLYVCVAFCGFCWPIHTPLISCTSSILVRFHHHHSHSSSRTYTRLRSLKQTPSSRSFISKFHHNLTKKLKEFCSIINIKHKENNTHYTLFRSTPPPLHCNAFSFISYSHLLLPLSTSCVVLVAYI